MSISKEDFINYFAKKITNEGTSVFLGAGTSSESGLPTWKDLLDPLARELKIDIDNISDYYQLSQYYSNEFGINALKRKISSNIRSKKNVNSTLHHLLSLNFNSIWTTNYDLEIENYFFEKNLDYFKIYNDKDLVNVNHSESTIIYKLNGDIHDLENIVLTQEDWENYELTHPNMITFLKRELISNTFIFIGYSFSDNLVTTILSNIIKFIGKSSNYHYTIMKKRETKEFEYFIDNLEKRYHIKTLLVKDYFEIPEILNEISKKVRERNIFISGRMDDLTIEDENYACELCRAISISLLKNDYNICTGMGRKIGYFITGPGIQYLLMNKSNQIDKRIKIRPFDDTLSKDDTTLYREKLIATNHIVIIIFGHNYVNGKNVGSKGVREEFDISKKMGKKIIPVGSTGYEAKSIFKDVKENLIQYPYLEQYIDILENEKNISIIAKAIIEIIDNILF